MNEANQAPDRQFSSNKLIQGGSDCVSERQTAKSFLRSKIQRLHDEARQLQQLHDALPEVLPSHADSALWNLLAK